MTRLKDPRLVLSALALAAVLMAGCLPNVSPSGAQASGKGGVQPKRPAASTPTTTAPPTPTTAPPPAPTTTTTVAPTPAPGGFVHPGILMDRADLDFVRAKIAAGEEPWTSALAKMSTTGGSSKTALRPVSYRYSSLSYPPSPVPVIQEAGSGHTAYINANPELGLANIGGVEHLDDARAAYTHALLWYYTGNPANAAKAIQIMNAWSSKLTEIKFDQPRRIDNGAPVYDNGKLQAGWGGTLFARAAEIIRYSGSGWSSGDISRFETMLDNVYLPLVITGWGRGANWLMTFAEATISIGVFTNNRATFNAGVAYWRQKTPTTIYMPSDGPLPVAPDPYYATAARMQDIWHQPTAYVAGLQGETLRDLSHMAMGLGAMSNGAQTAKLQGVDLFGEEQSRILAGYERSAGYVNEYLDKVAALGGAQPPSDWRPTGWVGPRFALGGGAFQRGWEVAYSHYAVDLGIPMPNTRRLVMRSRPTGPALHMSWETLTHAR